MNLSESERRICIGKVICEAASAVAQHRQSRNLLSHHPLRGDKPIPMDKFTAYNVSRSLRHLWKAGQLELREGRIIRFISGEITETP